MHYILTLSYRGAGLSGWQIQNNAVTVQGELDRALGMDHNMARMKYNHKRVAWLEMDIDSY